MVPSAAGASSSSIKPCKRCKCIAQSGLKCVICGTVSHNSCVGLLKSSIKVIDDKSIVCCDLPVVNNKDDLEASFDSAKDFSVNDVSKMEVHYLKEIIIQKDTIIQNQIDVITSLKQQINLLNKFNVDKVFPSDTIKVKPSTCKKNNRKQSSATSGVGNAGNAECATSLKSTMTTISTEIDRVDPSHGSHGTKKNLTCKQPDVGKASKVRVDNENSTDKLISKAEVSNAIHQTETILKCQEFININDKPFMEVNYKRNRRLNKAIIGNNENLTSKIRPNHAFLHVFKLHPEFTVEELTEIIKPVIPEAVCEQMDSKYPHYYSSFKVTVNDSSLSAALNPEIWPKGAWVNRFFHPRKNSLPAS